MWLCLSVHPRTSMHCLCLCISTYVFSKSAYIGVWHDISIHRCYFVCLHLSCCASQIPYVSVQKIAIWDFLCSGYPCPGLCRKVFKAPGQGCLSRSIANSATNSWKLKGPRNQITVQANYSNIANCKRKRFSKHITETLRIRKAIARCCLRNC